MQDEIRKAIKSMCATEAFLTNARNEGTVNAEAADALVQHSRITRISLAIKSDQRNRGNAPKGGRRAPR